MRTRALCFMLFFGLCHTPVSVTAGKVLIWPVEFSHWLNVKVIMDELITRGHNLTVVTHSASPSVKTDRSTGYNVEVVPVSYTQQDVVQGLNDFLNFWIYELSDLTVFQAYQKMSKIIEVITEQNHELCRTLFMQEDLLERLRNENFDAIVLDPVQICGDLLAEKLNLPRVISLRFSFGNTMERLCGQLPAPPSYVPAMGLGYTEDMDFTKRAKNLFFYVFQDIVFNILAWTKWDPLYTEVMGCKQSRKNKPEGVVWIHDLGPYKSS